MPLGAIFPHGARVRAGVARPSDKTGSLLCHAVGGHSQVGPAGRISASTSGRMETVPGPAAGQWYQDLGRLQHVWPG